MDFALNITHWLSFFVIDLFLFHRLFETKLKIRKQVVLCTIFWVIWYGTHILLHWVDFIHQLPVFMQVTFSNLNYIAWLCILARFVFVGKVRAFAFWGIISFLLNQMIDVTFGSILIAIDYIALYTAYFAGGIMREPRFLIVYRTIYTMINFLTRYLITIKANKGNVISVKESIGILIPTAICVTVAFTILSYCGAVYDEVVVEMLAIISVAFFVIIVSIIMQHNYLSANHREKSELMLQAKTHAMTKEHTQQIQDVYGKLETLHHDLRNHFGAITGYLQAGKHEEAKAYLEKITEDSADIYTYCKSPVLNALVSSKAKIAKEEKIKFDVVIALPSEIPLTDVELCILVGNMLDNAFEAKGEQPEFYVDLSIKQVDAYLVVSCKNKSDKAEGFTSSDSLQSTKKDDKHTHDIGTRQIKKTAESTGGFVTYKHEGGEFSALAMLKL